MRTPILKSQAPTGSLWERCSSKPHSVGKVRTSAARLVQFMALFAVMLFGYGSQANAQIANCVTVICPPDLVTNYTCDDVVIFQNPPLLVTNNCPGFNVQIVCQPPLGSPLPLGATQVRCAVMGPNQQIFETCSFTILVVRDTVPPEIRCPDDMTVTVCPDAAGGCGSVVNYPAPLASDNSGIVAVTCVPPPGSVFACGTTVVSCTAVDRCQNTAKCDFKITVEPIPAPIIQCPTAVITVTIPCGTNCVPVTYPLPIVTGGTLIGCTPAPGTCLPVGIHTVTCRARNQCGVVVGCEFQIRVLQSQGEPPSIVCPQDILVTTCSNCTVVNFPAPIVVDGSAPVCTPPSGTCFPLGSTSVSCVSANPCGTSECKFIITVRPVPPPTIQCPTAPIVVTVPCGTNCVPVFYPAPVVTGGTLIGCTPPSGTCLPVGIHTIVCRARNECGVVVGCEFDIRVIQGQGEPPIITCPPDITALTCSNCTVVNFPAPVVANGVLIGCTPPSGTCFPLGITTVNCIARNNCSGSECKFDIVVRPVPPPTIQCPSNIVVTVPCGTNCVPVFYPAPIVINGGLVGCFPPSGTCLPVGQHVVSCRATNICGQVDGCEFVVTVRPGDTQPPTIQCPSDIVVTTCNNCQIVSYPAPVVSAGATVVCTPPSGTCFPLGNTIVNCVASNDCGTKDCKFTVTVREGRPCVKPPLNMVLWLPLDEPVGPIANNIVPGAPNGAHANGPVPLLGQFVLNSLGFDGVNDTVRVPHYAAIGLGMSDMTIDAWVLRRDTGGRRAIVSKVRFLATGALRGYEFYLDNGLLKLDLAGVSSATFNSATLVPADNQWHHVAVTVRRAGAGVVRFYLDGVGVASLPGPIPNLIGNSNPLFVGSSGLGGGGSVALFRGFIDEVEIFNRSLLATEITSLFTAGPAGKCKIRCIIPWDVSFPLGQPCVTVTATLCNSTAVPQPVTWTATGPMPIPTPGGNVVIPPFSCINFPVTICRPTNGAPVGSVVTWTMTVYSGNLCPITCVGSVINPGPIVVTVPTDVIAIPGTNATRTVRIGLNGLPPGQPVRLRAIGPDMEPDLRIISLNGLPPGQPVIISGFFDIFTEVSIRFAEAEPIGLYTILVEIDVDGDGDFDVPASFDVRNLVVAPPTIRIVSRNGRHNLFWEDEGDGLGFLETSKEVDGPWEVIPNAGPGYPVDPSLDQQFFRVMVPEIQ